MREYRFATLDSFDGTGDGMTFSGMAIPFDQMARINSEARAPYDEVFRKGAFAKTISEHMAKPVPLNVAHDYRSLGIGVAQHLEETPNGLYGVWRLSDVPAGREAATLIRDRVATGLSVGFEPINNVTTRAAKRADGDPVDLVERTEVRLWEVSLCQFPAYEAAGVTAQRTDARKLADLAEARQALTDRFGRVQR